MILPRYIDMDRLEATITLLTTQQPRGRGEGKTVAYLFLMLGEALLGDPQNNYLYIGVNNDATSMVMRDFRRLASAYAGTIVRTTGYSRISIGEQQFLFYSVSDLVTSPDLLLSASFDRVFFDVDDQTRVILDTPQTASAVRHIQINLLGMLLHCVADRQGDVL